MTQDNAFQKKSLLQRAMMPLSELEAYHRADREYRFEHNMAITGIWWRKMIHPILLGLLVISRIIAHDRLHIFRDQHIPSKKPVIFACTHIGWKDIEMNFASIKQHAYLFLGDPRGLYRRIEGILLRLNGIICLDTNQKKDRFIGKETCVRLLHSGGNLLIFPEGAWNVTVDQVVMPLFAGTAEIAIRTGAEIIPVATEQYGKDYYVNIGKNISVQGYELSQKQMVTDKLRDTLCTLKWEIWEKHGIEARSSIPSDYLETFLGNFKAQMDEVVSFEDIHTTRFHPKVTHPEEAFSHLRELIPRKENAFLWNKRYYMPGLTQTQP